MTGPKVSHSSNHAASSLRLRRATKLVVMELSIAGAFVAAVGGSHEPDGSAGLGSGFENASEDTAMKGAVPCKDGALRRAVRQPGRRFSG